MTPSYFTSMTLFNPHYKTVNMVLSECIEKNSDDVIIFVLSSQQDSGVMLCLYNVPRPVRARQFGSLTHANQFDELAPICGRVSLFK